jgi:hypothetical protein
MNNIRKVNAEEAEEIENVLINDFIKYDLEIFSLPGLEGDAEYSSLPPQDKEAYDLASAQYFKQAQEAQALSNDKYKAIDFSNFVKLHIPDEGFVEFFRENQSEAEDTPAHMWHKVYNRNTNLMKESALKGLRRMIASQM